MMLPSNDLMIALSVFASLQKRQRINNNNSRGIKSLKKYAVFDNWAAAVSIRF